MKWLWAVALIVSYLGGAISAQASDLKIGIWVNPVRGRERWVSPEISHLEDQIRIGVNQKTTGTWLLGYQALMDPEITNKLQERDGDEVGAWLEVDEQLAGGAGIFYDRQRPWYDPGVVFLSAYERYERTRLIDRYYRDFKNRWGKWPETVGAWWIDSWSLNYIKNKYGLETIMIVADQKGTDGYGVWGQWTGVPYWPSKNNLLVPAKNEKDNLGSVVIQWAQRDLKLGYQGSGPAWSNNSVQANDYLSLDKSFDFFKTVAKPYIEAGQITLGLEVGQEASGNLDELSRQIGWAKNEGVEFVTMSQLKQKYRNNNDGINQPITIEGWILTTDYRENKELGQKVYYPEKTTFGDYFKSDKSNFLDRNLENLKPARRNEKPWWIVLTVGIAAIGVIKRKWWAVGGIIWALNSWGLVLRSGESLGWEVYYGPVVEGLTRMQPGLVGAGIGVGFWQRKKMKEMVGVFGIIPILGALRYTVIEGIKYVGIMINNRWVGWPRREFSGLEMNSMLRFPWDKIWSNPSGGIMGYPIAMIALGLALSWLLGKANARVRRIILVILWSLMVINLFNIWQAAPRVVIQ